MFVSFKHYRILFGTDKGAASHSNMAAPNAFWDKRFLLDYVESRYFALSTSQANTNARY